MDSKHSNGYNVKGMSGKSDLILISNVRSLALLIPFYQVVPQDLSWNSQETLLAKTRPQTILLNIADKERK